MVPAVYAATHFFGEATRIPFESVTATSGWLMFAGFFAKFREPTHIADAFLALYIVGVLLALVRIRWGDIAGCIGLHAGLVTVKMLIPGISTASSEGSWSLLVSDFDGLLGLWVCLVAAVVCAVVWKFPHSSR
jgi:hypothetical protein